MASAPTDFEVVFDTFVDDCASAEATIHGALSKRGYKAAEDRELFRAPIREVVELVQALPAPRSSPARGLATVIDPSRAADLIMRDQQYTAAVELIAKRATVSTPDLMRHLDVGFGRAQTVMDRLETARLVRHTGPGPVYRVDKGSRSIWPAMIERVRPALEILNRPTWVALLVVGVSTMFLPSAPLRTVVGYAVVHGSWRLLNFLGPVAIGQPYFEDVARIGINLLLFLGLYGIARWFVTPTTLVGRWVFNAVAAVAYVSLLLLFIPAPWRG